MTEITLQEQLTLVHEAITDVELNYLCHTVIGDGDDVINSLFELYKLTCSDFICHELQCMANFFESRMRRDIITHKLINIYIYDKKVKEFNEGLE